MYVCVCCVAVLVLVIRVAYAPVDAAENSDFLSKRRRRKEMKKFITVLCILAISSSAMAFFEDFEAMVTSDLDVSPWTQQGTNDAVITTGLGTNTSNVLQIGYLNGALRYIPAEADQFSVGTLEFDLNMNGPAPTYPSLYIYTADDDTANLHNYMRIHSETGAGGDDLDLYDNATSSVVLTDFMSRDDWVKITIDFDCDTDTFDFSVDDVLLLDDQAAWGDAAEINRISFNNANGYYAQMDNLSLVPEPATIALLGLGGLLIRRKK